MKPLGVGKLPQPPKSISKILGPSFILLGLGLGTGELILWPYLVSNWGLGIIWGGLLGITMQFFLNTEIERYTLANGESVFVGFARMYKYLPIWFIFSTIVAFAWPGFTAAAAGVLRPLLGVNGVKYAEVLMLVLVGVILTLGPVLYKTVETLQKLLILVGIPTILLIVAKTVHINDLVELAKGMVGIGNGYLFLPKDLPLMSFLAAFAYSGAGGNLNLAQSFYVKAKGYGMGRYSGRITSLITGKKEKILIEGRTFAANKREVKKFSKWWRLINTEHLIIFWGLGLLTILLLAVLANATVSGMGTNIEGINFVFNQANVVGSTLGLLFKILLLVVTSLMLFSTQLAVIDASGRIVAENVTLLRGDDIKSSEIPKVYYSTIWALLCFGIIILLAGFNEPRTLIVIGAVLNALCMFVFSGLLNKLNTSLLPKEIHPSKIRRLIVDVVFIFFGIFTILVFLDKLL